MLKTLQTEKQRIRRKTKKALGILLALTAALLFTVPFCASAAETVDYLYYDTEEGGFTTGHCSSYTVPNNSNTANSVLQGWYVVTGSIRIDHPLTVGTGGVHLILTNGSTLDVYGGIHLPRGCTLSVYGQAGNHDTFAERWGHLYSDAKNDDQNIWRAGIGGFNDRYANIDGISSSNYDHGGTLIVHGGNVTAIGSVSAAGIGGSYDGQGCSVTVYDGEVKGVGGTDGAGIGGGGGSASGGSLTVYGGSVTGEGGYNAAGIGGGARGTGGSFTIYDGSVTAYGDAGAAGIGGGRYGAGGTAMLYGGKVNAVGSVDDTYPEMFGKSIGPGARSSGGSVIIPDTVRVAITQNGGIKTPVNNTFLRQDWKTFFEEKRSYSFSVIPAEPVTYRFYDTASGVFSDEICGEYATVCKNKNVWEDGCWYVVTDSGEYDDFITVDGRVHLIIKDGCTLKAKKGILVGKDSYLTVYAQSEGDGMGVLIAEGADNTAGIGGGSAVGAAAGRIVIMGGDITAEGGRNAAGIGGGNAGNGGAVEIYGGKITAAAGTNGSRAIGMGASGADCGTIKLRNGYVPTTEDGTKMPQGLSPWTDILCTSSVSFTLQEAELSGSVSYRAYDTENGSFAEHSVSGCTILTKDTVEWKNGWYAAEGSGSIDTAVTVTGDVSLILTDSCDLTVNGGIRVTEGSSLTVYAQSDGAGMGSLTALGEGFASGIGSGAGQNAGDIVIHGGFVNAVGGTSVRTDGGGNITEKRGGAGIGAGCYGVSGGQTGGSLTVYGGKITAVGGANAAGIGGGTLGSGASVSLYGGTVTATGGEAYPAGTEMPAFGGGMNADDDGSVTFKPGTGPVERTTGVRLSQDALSGHSVSFVVFASEDVPYLAYSGSAPDGEFVTAYQSEYTILGENAATLTDGWYVAVGDRTYEGVLRVQGHVDLVLADGCTLNVKGGINVNEGNSLTVYAQSEDSGKGTLLAGESGINPSGIGSEHRRNAGGITICGGSIRAEGKNGAGIGGGLRGDGGAFTMYGGEVTAFSTNNGAGIGGGGNGGGAGTIVIYGGTVTAQGNLFGSGLGGSDNSDGSVTVYGGDVTAVGGEEYGRAVLATLNVIPYAVVTADDTTVILDPEDFAPAGGRYAKVRYNCGPVAYRYFDTDELTFRTGMSEKTRVIKSGVSEWTSGMYAASGDVTLNEDVKVTGDVKLILTDLCRLVVNGTVEVEDGSSLTIYAQSENEEYTGSLSVTGTGRKPGIGGGEYDVFCDPHDGSLLLYGRTGNITIHGGKIEARGAYNAAGIGGGYGSDGGNVTVYGGAVSAFGGENASGIGCGYYDRPVGEGETVPTPVTGGTLKLYGGTVTADGSELHIHERILIPVSEPTCTEPGSTGAVYVCRVCGAYFEDPMGDVEIPAGQAEEYVIPASGHSWGELWICDENGGHYRICTVCSAESGHEAHSYENSEYVDNGDGTHSIACEFCGDITEPAAHSFENSPYYDGGAETGFHFKKCEFCGAEDTHEPHSYVGGVCEYCAVHTSAIRYSYYDTEEGKTRTALCDTFIPVIPGLTSWKDGKCYVADGSVTLDGTVITEGDVRLILRSGCELTVNGGINVPEGTSLSVYEEADGTENGVLIAKGVEYGAGIGGRNGENVGTITIHGGKITAEGGYNSAGIGGSYGTNVFSLKDGGTYGSITVCGGEITATGNNMAPGIGGVVYSKGGSITVIGGTVYAEGDGAAAGIGIGVYGKIGIIAVRGGSVSAIGGSFGDGIGYGHVLGIETESSELRVSGGRIYAETKGSGSGARAISDMCYLSIPYEMTVRNGAGDIIRPDYGMSWNDCFPGDTETFFCDPRADVDYLAYNPESGVFETLTCTDYGIIDHNTSSLEDGWYVLDLEGTFEGPLKVSGDAKIILKNDCDLVLNGGIRLENGNSLTVYAEPEGLGKLTVSGMEGDAGIGGRENNSGGTFTMHGGNITACGGPSEVGGGAGIGGGAGREGGSITVYGGSLTARGAGGGAGIGGGEGGAGGEISVIGGSVHAFSEEGSAIGAGSAGNDGSLQIGNGMTVRDGDGNPISLSGAQSTAETLRSYGELTVIERDRLSVGFGEDGFTVTASGESSGTGTVTVALYADASAQRLLEVKIFDLAGGELPKGSFSAEGGCIRAFWWTDLETLIPLCAPAEVSVNE